MMKLLQWVLITIILAATWPFPFETGTDARVAWTANAIRDCSGVLVILNVLEKEGIGYTVATLNYNQVIFAQLKDGKEIYFWITSMLQDYTDFFKVYKAMPADGLSICDILGREWWFEEGKRTDL